MMQEGWLNEWMVDRGAGVWVASLAPSHVSTHLWFPPHCSSSSHLGTCISTCRSCAHPLTPYLNSISRHAPHLMVQYMSQY